MQYSLLGRTGLKVSRLSFGASSLGGVFHAVDEEDAIAAVQTALDCGINYFDVAPAYGGTRAETVLGKALRNIPRHNYVLSTKVGKYTHPDIYGQDVFDYSQARTRGSIEESAKRLGTEYFDIVHLHDIEYLGGKYTNWALTEGYDALQALKREGRIGNVSIGIYPMALWRHIFTECDIDAALVHNHYCLNDTQLLELMPMAKRRGIGIINASPFASGLLTNSGAASWHPASKQERTLFQAAAAFCQDQGTSIEKVAMQFASQQIEIPTTMFSTSRRDRVKQNVQWHEEAVDGSLVKQIQQILMPISNKEWKY